MKNSESRINHWNLIRVIVMTMFFFSGSKLFYKFITNTVGMEVMILMPFAIISFLGALIIPSTSKIIIIHKKFVQTLYLVSRSIFMVH